MRTRIVGMAAAIVCVVALGGAAAAALARVGVNQGYAPEQPIAFSHAKHAGESRIPCLYCHYGARRSREAGIPPVSVCMNCHGMLTKQTTEIEKLKEFAARRQPIAWTRVHRLPDFVSFNHSIHVSSAVACQECHGPVETMARVEQRAPLTMGWCLGCHRRRRTDGHAPAANLDCGKCHY